jgi:galactose mutarotase-like enzyme
MRLHECTYETFSALAAENPSVAVTMLPELGGKLVSLRDLRTEHEWLWRSDRLKLSRQPHGASYIQQADVGGWDECFPTVAPCVYPLAPYQPRPLPDHGDLWSQAWTTEVQESARELRIAGSCRGVTLPCTFCRTLTLPSDAARIDMAYEVRNCGDQPLAFIWSAHPLFTLSPGMRLEFPRGSRFNSYSATAATHLPRSIGLEWPFTVYSDEREIALDPLPGPDAGIAFKIWSEPLTEGWATLSAPQGSLRFGFDVAEIPQIALWLNAGGWSGIGGEPYCNLALEPCIGAQDSLEEAILKYGQYGLLPPGASRRWHLAVELHTSTRPE